MEVASSVTGGGLAELEDMLMVGGQCKGSLPRWPARLAFGRSGWRVGFAPLRDFDYSQAMHAAPKYLQMMAIAFVIALPSSGFADIVARDLGKTADGEAVKGYVYQSGRSRSTSRKSRLGPRVSSPRRYYQQYIPAPIVVSPVHTPYFFGRHFYGTTTCRLAPLSFRAVSVGSRFSIKLGY